MRVLLVELIGKTAGTPWLFYAQEACATMSSQGLKSVSQFVAVPPLNQYRIYRYMYTTRTTVVLDKI